jgi:glycosyltransferase involved in cell wall biosynthesis
MSKKPFLSLCMIVKNESKILEKSLKYISPLFDEIIIVDTGSTDNTREIIAKLGLKPFSFRWTGDIADARNYAHSLTSGEYTCTWDADWVLRKNDLEKLKKLKEEKFQNKDSLYLNWITEYDDKTLLPKTMLSRLVIFKKNKFTYECKVPLHDKVVPIDKSAKITRLLIDDIWIYHEKSTKDKRTRYTQTHDTLKKHIKSINKTNENYTEALFFYLQSCFFLEYFEETVKIGDELLALKDTSDVFYTTIIEYKITSLLNLKKIKVAYDIALANYNSKIKDWRVILSLADTVALLSPLESVILFEEYLKCEIPGDLIWLNYERYKTYPYLMLGLTQNDINNLEIANGLTHNSKTKKLIHKKITQIKMGNVKSF